MATPRNTIATERNRQGIAEEIRCDKARKRHTSQERAESHNTQEELHCSPRLCKPPRATSSDSPTSSTILATLSAR